ncbi:E3 ubiquitin-protein ligase UHRF2-like isoform X1 [Gadus chalcogrammus]|uniref:E3 ubiquitin-protein ligase UHRF2-like isoform X1 n=1 Tax=Gadus chalcogrammus TaxID=1042646 RepID=UPI0024C27A58|nr:E3 ubiquitin-protein ligase UHRF2-like isoform X1 [Gadus chalcogrammus]
MWIQIRTIDGKETRTIEDLSRLTKIESLRLKIQEIFHVNPEQQRLFYRGKQMEDGQTLFDYSVGLNDIVQLLIRSQSDPPDGPPGPRENPRDVALGPREGPMDRPPTAAAATATPCGSNSPSPGSNSARAPQPPALPKTGPAHATDITSVIVNNNNNNNNKSGTVASSLANNNNNKCNTAKPEPAVATTNFADAKHGSGTGSGSGSGSKPSHPAPDTQPSTSSRPALVDPGIGVYKINELVDCRDVTVGAWFEASVENVTKAPPVPVKGKVGRPPKRTNGKLEAESGVQPAPPPQGNSGVDAARGSGGAALAAGGATGSSPLAAGTDSAGAKGPAPAPTADSRHREEDVVYHIKYDDYPENGVVEMLPVHVRPRARTLLRWDQLSPGLRVMVNHNLETPEERGFWFDAEVHALNQASRTSKELRVNILLGGSGDVIRDCKVHFLDEVYQVEIPGARALSAADGQFKRKSGPECKHCRADPDAECRFCSCCVCGGKQDAHMQLLCDECNMAFHIYCLSPPLATIPDDEDWYCPTCKNDTSEVIKAGEKLKASKKKAKMPSATTESQRDWGKGMACVGRTKECTIVPSNHYGPVPGVPVGTTWKFRVQVSEAGVHRPHVGGIHGRSNDGSYSLVLAGGFEDEVDRGDEFTYTGSGGRDLSGNKRIGEHSFDQTLTHMNRALALNCDAPLNDKDGAESRNWREGKPVRVVRSSKGRRISKYAPEEGNRYDGIYKVVKYWPEIGKCGFLVWRYLLRRDDLEPAAWTPEGLERSKKLSLAVQYPPGYLEAMANKTKREASARGGGSGRGKRHRGRGRPRIHPRVEEVKEEPGEQKPVTMEMQPVPRRNGEGQKTPRASAVVTTAAEEIPAKRIKVEESFQLSVQQRQLIQEDTANRKLWDEAMVSLAEGQNFLCKVEQMFMCVCCQELAYHPVTTVCTHNVCKTCLQRSFRAEVYTCPACRHDLGKDYGMGPNKTLQILLDQFFPGYSKGR